MVVTRGVEDVRDGRESRQCPPARGRVREVHRQHVIRRGRRRPATQARNTPAARVQTFCDPAADDACRAGDESMAGHGAAREYSVTGVYTAMRRARSRFPAAVRSTTAMPLNGVE